MEDGQTDVVLLWEGRAMSEQNLLVSAGSAPAPNNLTSLFCKRRGQDGDLRAL
jgi:hypothetical protein